MNNASKSRVGVSLKLTGRKTVFYRQAPWNTGRPGHAELKVAREKHGALFCPEVDYVSSLSSTNLGQRLRRIKGCEGGRSLLYATNVSTGICKMFVFMGSVRCERFNDFLGFFSLDNNTASKSTFPL